MKDFTAGCRTHVCKDNDRDTQVVFKRLQEKVQAQSPLYKFTSTQSLLLFSWEKILNHGTSWALGGPVLSLAQDNI